MIFDVSMHDADDDDGVDLEYVVIDFTCCVQLCYCL